MPITTPTAAVAQKFLNQPHSPVRDVQRVGDHPVGCHQFDPLLPYRTQTIRDLVEEGEGGSVTTTYITYDQWVEEDITAGTTPLQKTVETITKDSAGEVVELLVLRFKAISAWDDRETAEWIPRNRDTFNLR